MPAVDAVEPVPYGTWEIVRHGKDCALLAVGVMTQAALEAAEGGTEIGIEALGAGEIEVEIVERGGFDGRGEILEDAADARGGIGVGFVLAGGKRDIGTELERLAKRHRGADAALVAGAYDGEQLLDARLEGVVGHRVPGLGGVGRLRADGDRLVRRHARVIVTPLRRRACPP